MVTVRQLHANAQVQTLADKLSEIKVKTLALRLIDAEVEAEVLLHGLGDTVAEAEAETLYKTLSNIKA